MPFAQALTVVPGGEDTAKSILRNQSRTNWLLARCRSSPYGSNVKKGMIGLLQRVQQRLHNSLPPALDKLKNDSELAQRSVKYENILERPNGKSETNGHNCAAPSIPKITIAPQVGLPVEQVEGRQ